MLRTYFDAGGPVMYLVLVLWVVLLAGILDRGLYALGRVARRPLRRLSRGLACTGDRRRIAGDLAAERRRAERGLDRIDAVSQLAPSVGLFGTVLGISRSFFARGAELEMAASEVMASGLATALFTTVAGLIVFLVGQGFLVLYREWLAWGEEGLAAALEEPR